MSKPLTGFERQGKVQDCASTRVQTGDLGLDHMSCAGGLRLPQAFPEPSGRMFLAHMRLQAMRGAYQWRQGQGAQEHLWPCVPSAPSGTGKCYWHFGQATGTEHSQVVRAPQSAAAVKPNRCAADDADEARGGEAGLHGQS